MSFLGKSWSDDMIQRLKELVGQGCTAGNISTVLFNEFGYKLTRSSIAGRVYRMRIDSKDDTFRLGLAVGRQGGPAWNAGKAMTREERLARHRESCRKSRLLKRNGGGVMSAIKAAATAKMMATKAKKTERKWEALGMMRNHICCCANPVDLFARTGCCWPLWGDEEMPFSERLYCNNINEMGAVYCPAHMRRRHEHVQGAFLPKPKGLM